uniref:Uncharacterized protein n=1 Tax=Prorocentrum micans TaxID=2945 RepID=A0A7S2TE13_PROMC|mmetsp:Transcript_9388/g.7155  ORF Transcript_9388/g.7155 Transcript_9388/m.7155 type:complete len:111 (+) Transcript_9388:143-475(+)
MARAARSPLLGFCAAAALLFCVALCCARTFVTPPAAGYQPAVSSQPHALLAGAWASEGSAEPRVAMEFFGESTTPPPPPKKDKSIQGLLLLFPVALGLIVFAITFFQGNA